MFILRLSLTFLLAVHLAIADNQQRPVRNYRGIDVDGPFQVTVDLNGKEGAVLDTADPGLFERVQTVVDNQILRIRFQGNGQDVGSELIKVFISAFSLVSLEGNGPSRMTVLQSLKEPNIQLVSKGSSWMSLSVDTFVVRCQLTGSGTIEINGKCAGLDVIGQGSPSFKGLRLETDVAVVSVQANGQAEISVKAALAGHVSGKARLRYDGAPQVNVKTSGTGSVVHV
ncbi:hypothetical protein BV898_04135 [Hypsibius exemplaris]|uniref:Putative auto-transporter adhesin head GIN domain-containing protein n=1 Tax=Hypsibius exemplaris TaxID=2072580 RepID=A0A1W0X3Q2_HYPEX|nr:hypothetical protein BV898_04135 [Hypsibius exemplaris]